MSARALLALALIAAAPLDQAARDRLAATERAASEARRDSAAATTGSVAAQRRAASARAQLGPLTARVAESERRLAVAEQRLRAIEQRRSAQRTRLAAEQRDVTRLLAALETMARRPSALALVEPASARDIAHTRMALDAMTPGLAARTAKLRTALVENERLAATLGAARDREATLAVALARDRAALTRAQAEASRDAVVLAARASTQRQAAQSLAIDAASLRDLVNRLGAPAGAPGANLIMRWPTEGMLTRAQDYEGMPDALSLATAPAVRVANPAAGRVAFSGLFRSYGGVVILDHGGGWRSILSGLGTIKARTGAIVPAGATLGTMPAAQPVLRYELRQGGRPVDPLPHLPALAAACRSVQPFAHKGRRAMQAPSSRIEVPCRVRI